ncbi:MAG: phage tail tape measure protein [Sarcina sp.]
MAGAVIKIGANSSEFQKQMKAVTKELKLVSSECSVASQKAKLFGTTQDQLGVKHRELTAKIQAQNQMMKLHQDRITGINQDTEKQKNKQTELNTKIDEATKKYKESVEQTGKNSEESKKLKTELEGLKEEYAKNEKAIEKNNDKLTDATIKMNNTEKALLQNQRALQDVNKEISNAKLDKLAEGFDKVSNATGKASDKLKPVSTAIVGLGTASAAASITFEDSMAKVSTIADDTVVSYDDMKKAILDLSNQTGISANAIADDVYNAISAGQETGSAVNFVSESTKLAKAGFSESGQALDVLTTIMNSYGLEADQVGKVSDTLIQIQNKGKTTVGELSNSMGKLIPTANSMGVSLDQVGTGYALMTSKGIATSETTTYMNSLLNELGKSGTKASEALKKGTGKSFQELTKEGVPLGNVLVTLEKEAKKNGKSLADMFGSAEAGKAALVLAGDEGKAFSNMLKEMQSSAGATDIAFEKVNNTTGNKLKQSLNQVKNTGIAMGDALAPIISMIANAFSFLAGILSNLSQTQLQFIAGVGIGVVALNGALGAISKLTGGISSGIKAFKDIKENGSKAFEAIKNFGTTAVNSAKSVGTFALNLGKATIAFAKNAVQAGISAAQFIAHKVATIASTVATNAMALAQAALNFIMSLNPITLVIIAIGALVAAIIVLWNKCEWFRNLVMAMFEALKIAWQATLNFFKTIWDWFVGLWNAAVELFKTIWQGVCLYFETVWNFWKGIFEGVVNIIKTVWEGACTIFKTVWQGVCNTFKTLFEGFKTIFTTISNTLKTIWQGVCNIFSSAWNGVCSGITSVFTGVKNTVVGIAQSMTNTVIRAINWCITQLNKIKFSVPDWVPLIGGKSWGVNIPKVSEVNWLWKGGIIDSPTLFGGGFGVGDAYKGSGRQAEAVIPLETMYKKIAVIVNDVVHGNQQGNTNKSSGDTILQIENFNNNREIDIEQLVKELEFYRRKYT